MENFRTLTVRLSETVTSTKIHSEDCKPTFEVHKRSQLSKAALQHLLIGKLRYFWSEQLNATSTQS